MGSKHLTVQVASGRITVRGDTYNAREILRSTGFRARKVGESWEHYAETANPAQTLEKLMAVLYAHAKPLIDQHVEAAQRGGYPPQPERFAWTVTVVSAGREAHYIVLERPVPARWQSGTLIPVGGN